MLGSGFPSSGAELCFKNSLLDLVLIGRGKLLAALVRVPGSGRQLVMAVFAFQLTGRDDCGAPATEKRTALKKIWSRIQSYDRKLQC
jgi:hypothetical protein